MKLTSLRIKNFRSLEDVKLIDLQQFNVLIGKNNAGKSAVFSGLRFLADVVYGTRIYEWGGNIVSHFTKNEPLEYWLEFDLTESERTEVIQSIKINPGLAGQLKDSAFCRKISYHIRSSPGRPETLFPRKIDIFDEQRKWIPFQKHSQNGLEEKEQFHVSSLESILNNRQLLSKPSSLSEEEKLVLEEAGILAKELSLPIDWGKEEIKDWAVWPFILLGKFLKHSFFFDHFRKFYAEQQVGGTGALNQEGNNLVEVLHYWSNNHRPTFERIQKFVQLAFSGVGGLETPIKQKTQFTQTAFRTQASGEQIPLQHMGGGVAQLLMAAVALETTSPDYPIFLEEPETNLHPGAQRFLAERLCDEGRQVFITTHSPTFVNLTRAKSVHKVKMMSGRTKITSLNDETLHIALSEIGARNSDVLLSDAVVFVEGESDLQALKEWCRIADISLAGTNTSILLMQSIGRPEANISPRSQTLKAIAASAGIPHLFLIDCDEISEANKRKIKKDIGDQIHIFERREMENYLLIPRCLKLAIREKLNDSSKEAKTLEETSEKQLEKMIRQTADSLKNRILVKRIRSLLEAPEGGFFPRKMFEEFEPMAGRKELAKKLERSLINRTSGHFKKSNLSAIISDARKKLDKEWRNDKVRPFLAPGAEIMESLFAKFGLAYNKSSDARRVAKHMKQDDFCEEVVLLLNKIRLLTQRSSELGEVNT